MYDQSNKEPKLKKKKENKQIIIQNWEDGQRKNTFPDLRRELKGSCEEMRGPKGEGNGSNSQVGFSPPSRTN